MNLKDFRKMFFSSFLVFVIVTPFIEIKVSLIIGSALFCFLLAAFFVKKLVERNKRLLQKLTNRWENLKEKIYAKKKVYYLLIALFFSVFPFLTENNYLIDIITVSGIYIALALGINIVVGLAGLLDLGYVAFYAVGAYTYALLSQYFQLNFWLCLPMGGLLAAFFGFFLGLPTVRLRGDYLAIVTLGFGEIIRIILNNWDSLTGGPNGILGIPRPSLFGHILTTPTEFYYLIFALCIFTIFVVYRLTHSKIGREWVAIREDEVAAEVMGVATTKIKLLAFSLGAFWAGLAGVFFASKQRFISPESFTFNESVIILCMAVIGGLGSITGVIVGAFILVLLPEVLREFSNYRMLIFGASLVIIMIYKPQGFFGSKQRKTEFHPLDIHTLSHTKEALYDIERK